MRNEPSFLRTNKTGAPRGEIDSSMNPFSSNSVSCRCISASSAGDSRYCGLDLGLASGSRSIPLLQGSGAGDSTQKSKDMCTNAYWALELLVTKNKVTRTIRDNPIDIIIKKFTKDDIADRAEAVAQTIDAIWANSLGYTSLVKQHRTSP
ncbi:hypothetical protein GQ54DRAFT_303779 [Martensiomyces pterosporus]|nr:hypothetical protein GQ54DRAFT_303779 [Martensiomyces pterosporus]